MTKPLDTASEPVNVLDDEIVDTGVLHPRAQHVCNDKCTGDSHYLEGESA